MRGAPRHIPLPRFCEDCPLKKDCDGPVIAADKISFSGKRFGTGAFIGAFALLRDVNGRLSEALVVPANLDKGGLIKEVGECEYPEYKPKRFSRRQEAECRALAKYVIKDSQLKNIAKQLFG